MIQTNGSQKTISIALRDVLYVVLTPNVTSMEENIKILLATYLIVHFNPREVNVFSPETKSKIAHAVEKILKATGDTELPKDGNINFILHVDGAEAWSWANIRNNSRYLKDVPRSMIGNLSV